MPTTTPSKTGTLTVVKATPSIAIPRVSIAYGTTPTKLTASHRIRGRRSAERCGGHQGRFRLLADGHVHRLVVAAVVQRKPFDPDITTGGHTITATVAPDANYATVTKTGTLAVTKATQTIKSGRRQPSVHDETSPLGGNGSGGR